MTIVAVAGGTGNIGRTIVDAILATGKHQVKVLSRKANPKLEAEIGAPLVPVDYSDVDALAKVLEDNNVDTVVSGIAMHSEDGSKPHEVELIRAADRSRTTKRLISSEWGVPFKDEHIGQIPSVAHKREAARALEATTTLEHTVFHVGFLMDYWGLGPHGVLGVPSYLATRTPFVTWLDMAHGAAAIPGSGDVPVVFTHTADVARFVAASLDLPRWERETFVLGDRLTWNQFLRLAEEARGIKFTVAYDGKEKLKSGQTTELPGQVPLYSFFPKPVMHSMIAAFGLWFEDGVFDLKPVRFLNESFPEIKPLTVKEMLDKSWKSS
ncbi:isoflavone reductase [Corynascus novoguineensis]|uniref:Isoflavone reductase n=1 Tax=Corynascus novoguineensis TaxID=1126955 RepID=A0AAN7CUW6_9PEZI|nr:isoflavone reductase [Corynascus novoguineensis]